MDNQQLDFVAIGDIVTDAFIRLQAAELHSDLQREHSVICMAFGSKLPYESVTVMPAVGNSPNAAVAAARLGLKSALVTDLGQDHHGEEAIAALKANGVNTDFIRIHKDLRTNYHYVLWYADDRTILIKHEKYSYELANIDEPKWVYLSSLGENSATYHKDILGYLNGHSNINLAFQPGTFQIKAGADNLRGLYQRTRVFLSNLNEARAILKTNETEVKKILEGIHELGPRLVVITDGPKGAYIYDSETKHYWFMPPYPDPEAPFERTGAGDSFSATFVSALALGESVERALAWAPINSMAVVQKIGAQAGLLTREQLEEYLKNAPEDYRPKAI